MSSDGNPDAGCGVWGVPEPTQDCRTRQSETMQIRLRIGLTGMLQRRKAWLQPALLVVKELLRLGASLDIYNEFGKSAREIAAASTNEDIKRLAVYQS